MFATSRPAGRPISTSDSASRKASTACPTASVWNAAATGSGRAREPSASTAAATAAVGPPMTTWSGALSLQTVTPGWAARISSTSARPAATAAMAPAS